METSFATAVVEPTKRELIKQAVERKGKLNVKRGTIEPGPGKRGGDHPSTIAKRATKPAPAPKPPTEAKRGAKSLASSLTPTQLREEIDLLLGDLSTATDPDEKKKIRRKLRLRGHKGGLGKHDAKPAAK